MIFFKYKLNVALHKLMFILYQPSILKCSDISLYEFDKFERAENDNASLETIFCTGIEQDLQNQYEFNEDSSNLRSVNDHNILENRIKNINKRNFDNHDLIDSAHNEFRPKRQKNDKLEENKKLQPTDKNNELSNQCHKIEDNNITSYFRNKIDNWYNAYILNDETLISDNITPYNSLLSIITSSRLYFSVPRKKGRKFVFDIYTDKYSRANMLIIQELYYVKNPESEAYKVLEFLKEAQSIPIGVLLNRNNSFTQLSHFTLESELINDSTVIFKKYEHKLLIPFFLRIIDGLKWIENKNLQLYNLTGYQEMAFYFIVPLRWINQYTKTFQRFLCEDFEFIYERLMFIRKITSSKENLMGTKSNPELRECLKKCFKMPVNQINSIERDELRIFTRDLISDIKSKPDAINNILIKFVSPEIALIMQDYDKYNEKIKREVRKNYKTQFKVVKICLKYILQYYIELDLQVLIRNTDPIIKIFLLEFEFVILLKIKFLILKQYVRYIPIHCQIMQNKFNNKLNFIMNKISKNSKDQIAYERIYELITNFRISLHCYKHCINYLIQLNEKLNNFYDYYINK